ncbi:MAG: site-specific DNA-methyltransferase [Flavobacteriaceae bacterium]
MKITTLDGRTPDIAEENILKLKHIFPDVFTEDKVDFKKLQQVLGEYIEDSNERYNFTWNGKGQALRLSQTPSLGTLRPCKEESKDWDTTDNLYIEGDNLEVLKLLQKSYHSKIKMIYIDPPYNTGKDFVYPDDFNDSLENYKRITGQVDGNAKPISTNTEASGRYHTDWLNMTYPRLRLARNLLSDDGVIFISIDDNEVDNLKKICNEVFGEDNFVTVFPWRKRTAKSDVPFGVSQDYEWIVCYAKSSYTILGLLFERKYYESDDYPTDRWRLSDLTTQKIESQRPNSAFDLVDPKTGKVYKYNPKRLWGITRDTFQDYYDKGKIVFPDDYDFLNIGIPAYRVFESEDKAKALAKYGHDMPIKAISTHLPDDVGRTENGNKECSELLGNSIFSFPKPLNLIRRFITSATNKENADIILDFFSGSSTTAHAVMQLNAEDDGNRKFIMVQLPEPIDEKSEAYKAGYKNISEIGKERIRRAGEKIKEEKGLEAQNLDIGFKVLKLDTSNIRKWQPDYENLEEYLLDYVDNCVEGRTELDVVYEIMIKYGLDLTYSVDEFIIADKKVYSIGVGMLMICLDDDVTTEVAKGIIEKVNELSPESSRVVFKDNGFETDSNKTNIKEILKSGGIEEFITL